MKRIAVLLSGRGSNFEALLACTAVGDFPGEIVVVGANRTDARGIETARQAGIATFCLAHRDYPQREEFDRALRETLEPYRPDLVVLAGFMRILTPGFVDFYAGRMLNIHPSLLPAFPGLHTHERALAEGVRIHGCTVHFVTADLDHGPIVIQAAVPVLPGDGVDELASRVLRVEHRIYPQAVRWFCEGRLSLNEGRVALAPSAWPRSAMPELVVPQGA
ncbi:MAG: phosphoribosylglycinamide formyltransferase [Betaproteobacteria bacterium]|nr:phosphoribosylglycinamide formyltransferase [Betaproteobacteria bacterium]